MQVRMENGSQRKKFETEEEASAWIKKYKMYKYTPYICKICGKLHIGIKNKNLII